MREKLFLITHLGENMKPSIFFKVRLIIKKLFPLFQLIILSIVMVGTTGSNKYAQADELEIILTQDVTASSLDPRIMKDTTAYRACDIIYDGLIGLTPEFEPVSELAVSWIWKDSKTLVFKLRKDAFFSDGERVNAEDVKYTFDSLLDTEFNAPFRSLYTSISEVQIEDDFTVKFLLNKPNAALMTYMDIGIVPKHLGEDKNHNLGTDPVGSGPMRLTKWERGNKIVLEPNPKFWGKEPTVEKIIIQIIKDQTNRVQALVAGDVDYVASPLEPNDVPRMRENDKISSYSSTGTSYTYFGFNMNVPILSDKRMRRAIAYFIDRDILVDKINEGVPVKANNLMLPFWWMYTDDIKQPGHDPEKAKALLSEMGWFDTDNDGILDKDGKKLTIVLKTHSEWANRIQMIEYIQNVLSKNGFEAKTDITDWPAHSSAVRASNYQTTIQGWTRLVDPDYAFYHTLHSKGTSNWGGFNSPDYDKLVELGRVTTDIRKRGEYYQKAARILAEELPYYILYYQYFGEFWSKNLKGYEPNSRGYLRSWSWVTRN
jgi:peptide/nickel transport system substrate-binding protein